MDLKGSSTWRHEHFLC